MIWCLLLFFSLFSHSALAQEHHDHDHDHGHGETHHDHGVEGGDAASGITSDTAVQARIAAVEAAFAAGRMTQEERDKVLLYLQTKLSTLALPPEPGVPRGTTSHRLVLGVNFDTLALAHGPIRMGWVDHADPMIGWQINHCRENPKGERCSSVLLALGIGPNRRFLPSYLVDIEIHTGPKAWVGVESEGHLNWDEDDGVHFHTPNLLLSAGGSPGNFHVGGGLDIFHTVENAGPALGPALVIGWEWKNLHLHGHVSTGGLVRHPGVFATRASLHITVAVGGKKDTHHGHPH